ncbi:SDH family Clp fold serine proteinase [Sunxiuqinia dokdonensis]|uniref:Serine protease n=1 Tax=Sunxiuqinia dokdonensis TaxID=1409788 RepID=A0A0L8V7R3_9BACT|nr:serine protease [Sunxiuqinia dokdonensis]KOH44491.1 serine protease [Sunxiuqinia dokdonensis]
MLKERIENYKWLEEDRQSKLMVYITGDRPGMETQIATDVLDYFSEHLDKINKVPKISLLLYTRGGDTMAAWSLVNLIRQFCDEFEVIIPSKARSSGTIISLGADKIMMTKQATLGPIDPSLNSPLNPQNPQVPQNPQARIPVSVESIQGFFELAKQELKLKNEDNLKDVLLSLSEKVHPLVLGNVYRSRTQIQMVARKLLQKQLGADQKEKIDKIVAFLCSDSGSHDYAIYRNEARDELGLTVEKPNDEQYQKLKEIFEDIRNELKLLSPFNVNIELGNEVKVKYSCRRVLIESIEGGTHVYLSEGELTKTTQTINQHPPLPPIVRSTIENQMNFESWKYEENN